jgi:hypothetical protein
MKCFLFLNLSRIIEYKILVRKVHSKNIPKLISKETKALNVFDKRRN